MTCSRWLAVVMLSLGALFGWGRFACAAEIDTALAKIVAVGTEGAGHNDATAAARVVSQAEPGQLPQILAAMDKAGPLATNWLRIAAESVAQRAGQQLPKGELEKFLADTKHAPRARRLAYELIAAVDPTAEQRLIPTLLDDPSTELRRDAVAQLLTEAETISAQPTAIKQYQKALFHARDLDQIKAAAARLKDLGEKPDIAAQMGFVQNWKIIGPFDNLADKGWDTTYPPEEKIDLAAEYEGQKGRVKWFDTTSADDYGLVDLNKLLANHKGAVAYAYTEFLADKEQPCDLRMCCINANKVWLNGKLATSNHVYHSGDDIDQYIAKGTLKKGKNTILLKICQNEQTEAWAQRWQFQIRVCDAIGTGILSQDRPGQKVAAERSGDKKNARRGDFAHLSLSKSPTLPLSNNQ
ncbi:MAG: hypothetical protein SFU86_00870 [Pirellulaceae bacterium]|nr:hypothetical protein [Pirellulaceae bacterium]